MLAFTGMDLRASRKVAAGRVEDGVLEAPASATWPPLRKTDERHRSQGTMDDRPASSLLDRHQILAFVALTFAISWAIWWGMASMSLGIATSGGAVLNIVALSGPSITALTLSAVLGGGSLRRPLVGFSLARASAKWVIVALVLPLAMIVVAIAVSVLAFGAPTPVITIALLGVLATAFVRILFLGGPLGEELGWRGFALPRLQTRQTAYRASLLLGLIWGLWHIPLYFVPGTGQFETVSGGTDPAFAIGAFVGWTIGLSILFTFLFNETRGSLIVVILFHTSINLGAFVPAAVGSTGAASFLYAIVTWIAALIIVSRYGKVALASAPAMTVEDSTTGRPSDMGRRHR
jgi:membrane protease YdiL (CAAX protease family)